MNRVLRAIVAWLLFIALPLQGYAAGTMVFCGSAQAPVAAAEHPHDGTTAHENIQSHYHEASVADAEGFTIAHAVTHGKCSVCASCCGGAALLSTLNPLPPSAVPRSAPLLNKQDDMPGNRPARLERPPRLNLA